jgi:spore coat polysaccharide biosynthesis protein SpsF
MRVGAIVESRMTSTRLPGKNLKAILGRPMLERLLERLKRCRLVDVVCVATSDQAPDDPLQQLAERAGVTCYRGSLDDVLGRTLSAAQSVRADVIVEISGDCPLIDPGIVDAAVRRYLRGNVDYLVNVLDRLTFPIGFDVQVFGVKLLDEVSRLTSDAYDRTHVTPYFYRHAQSYRVVNLLAPERLDRPRYRLCVDYPEDLELVSAVYAALHPANPAFDAFDVVGFLDAHAELAALNTTRPDAFTFPTSSGGVRHEVLELDVA